MEYHFGVPGELIWSFHILLGMFLMYIGYQIVKNRGVSQELGMAIVILGSLSIAYHAHIFLVEKHIL